MPIVDPFDTPTGIVDPFDPQGSAAPRGIIDPFDTPDTQGIVDPFDPQGAVTPRRREEEDIETTFSGLAQSVGAGVAAGFTAPGRFLGAGLEVVEDITGINLPGEELTDVSKFAQEFWQKRIGKSQAEQLVGQASEALGTIASSLAVVAATGGTAAAATSGAGAFTAGAQAAAGSQALLYTLAAGAGLDKTATERRAGTPVLNAYGAGVVTFATEYITEKIPLGALQKISNGFFRKLAEGAVADVGGEMLSTAIELSVTDKLILNKDHHLTTEQYWGILKETAYVAMISTVGLSGSAKALSLTGSAVDATNTIAQPPNPLLLPLKEKVETTEEGAIERGDSKSEFPELARQTDPESPDINNELNLSTTVEPEGSDAPRVERPKTSFEETQDKSRADSYQKRRLSPIKVWKSFVKSWVDVSGNLQAALSKLGNDGLRVVMRQNAINGANSEASAVMDIIDKEVYSGFSQDERYLFDDYKAALRGIELKQTRGTEFQLSEGQTEQSLNDFLDRVPDKYKAMFETRNEAYKRGMDNLLELGLKEEVITPESVAGLREAGREYLPREVLDFIDPVIRRRGKDGKTISVRDSGLKNLSEDGSIKLVETDTRLLMEQSQQRMWTRVYRNRAALEMQSLARNNKDAGSIVRENKVKSYTNETYQYINEKGDKVSVSVKNEAALAKKLQGKQVTDLRKTKAAEPVFATFDDTEMAISVMNDGIRNELVMPVELGSEWITGDPILTATAASIIGWASGNKILKAMATTLNPEFAITNVPRDLAHIWMSTEEYSSLAPLAALQMHADMAAVLKDAVTKTGLYNEYIENGGGMEFLSHRGKLGLKGDNPLSKGISALESVGSKMGEMSETITRLALMRRAKRNGKTPFEAAQVARGYLDFARGGSAAKMVNSAVPFFNAGIQATRGIVRAAHGSPMAFGLKAFQVGAMAVGLYYANKKNYPEDWENVPDYDKENNFIFMLPLTYLDDEGRERRRYLRLPKDQGQKVFAMIFENMARRAEGEQVDGVSIANVVKDYLPIVPGEILPPALEMALGYSTNTDFWTREDIWNDSKTGPVLPQEEYNKYTPEVYVQAGKITGSSPARLKYATEQIFTRGNLWTSLVGYGIEEVMQELTPEERERVSNKTLDDIPGIRRLLKSTRPGFALQKSIEKQKIDLNTERFRRNREFDALSERFFEGETDLNEIKAYTRSVPKEDQRRIRRRFKTQRRMQGVTNRGFWFNMLELPPEARAANYWNKWKQLGPAERRELDRQSKRVPRFRSKRFNKRFKKMRRFGEQGERP